MREQQEYVVLTGSPVPSPDPGSQPRPLLARDPAQVGPYRIEARLGAGGMGTVYLGVDAEGRRAAVKVVRSDHVGDDTFRQRFRREVSAAARVRSRFTADLIAADVDAPEPWLATQYVPGPTLTRAVTDQGPLTEPALLDLIAGIAEALWSIHNVGLVHRDLKPSNVLLGPDGPCVIDLGVVRTSEATTLTTTGLQVGTPTFMSPEQARGDVVTPAADIWALGGLIYFAATGLRLFGDGQPSAVLYRVVHTEPDLTQCPPSVRPLVTACLAKDPAARPSAAAILAAVRPVGAPAPAPVRSAAPAGPPTPWPTATPAPGHATPVPGHPTPVPGLGNAVGPVPGVPLAPPVVSPHDDATGTYTHLAATGLHTPVLESPAPQPRRDRRRLLRVAAVVGAVVLVGSGLGTALAMADNRAEKPSAAVSRSASPSPTASPTPSEDPTPSASPTPTPTPEATPVAAAPPPPPEPRLFTVGTVELSGQAAVGQTLTVTATGVWSPAPDPAETTCVWYRGSNRLSTDGTCSYIVSPSDVGFVLGATMVAGAPDHEPAEVSTAKTATVVRGKFAGISTPVVSGKKVVGQTVTCTVKGLEAYPAAQVRYTWYRGISNGSAVFGGSTTKVAVPAEAVGHSLKCEITLKQTGYDDLVLRSDKFGLITAK